MSDDLLSFPCELPIKVFGRNEPEFPPAAIAIVREHIPELDDTQVTAQESRDRVLAFDELIGRIDRIKTRLDPDLYPVYFQLVFYKILFF